MAILRASRITLGAAALVVSVLSGCGSNQTETPTTGPKPVTPKAVASKSPVPQGAVSPNDLVLAVPASKNDIGVQVKFALLERPDLSQPLTVDIVIQPTMAGVDRVSGKVEVEDGLDLVEGQDIPATEKPDKGATIEHTVKVRPKRDGIFMVNALLTVEAVGQSSNGKFSIPVISGTGIPDLTPKSEAAAAGPGTAAAQPPAGGQASTAPPAAAAH